MLKIQGIFVPAAVALTGLLGVSCVDENTTESRDPWYASARQSQPRDNAAASRTRPSSSSSSTSSSSSPMTQTYWDTPAAAPTTTAGATPAASAPPGALAPPGTLAPPSASAAPAAPSAVAPAPLVSAERGRTLRYVPTSCKMVTFADVQRLAAAQPVSANRPLLADRARLALDQYPAVGDALRSLADALGQHGIDWRKSVGEASGCVDGQTLRIAVFEGSFDTGSVMDALRTWAQRNGRPEAIVSHDGREYVQISGNYVGAITPNIVGVAPDMAAIDGARPEQPGLQARGGDPAALVFVHSARPWGGEVNANVTPFGDDAFLVRTVVDRIDRAYVPEQDRPVLQQRVDDFSSRVRTTPLAPLADAVSRTEISFLGSTAQLQTVLPDVALGAAVARAASSSRGDWLALRPGSPPPSVGGGPAAGGATVPPAPADSTVAPAQGAPTSSSGVAPGVPPSPPSPAVPPAASGAPPAAPGPGAAPTSSAPSVPVPPPPPPPVEPAPQPRPPAPPERLR